MTTRRAVRWITPEATVTAVELSDVGLPTGAMPARGGTKDSGRTDNRALP